MPFFASRCQISSLNSDYWNIEMISALLSPLLSLNYVRIPIFDDLKAQNAVSSKPDNAAEPGTAMCTCDESNVKCVPESPLVTLSSSLYWLC